LQTLYAVYTEGGSLGVAFDEPKANDLVKELRDLHPNSEIIKAEFRLSKIDRIN
jgi:hypothetical protein